MDRPITYTNFIYNFRLLKVEPHYIMMEVGTPIHGGDVGSTAVYLVETKLIINSVISSSKKEAHFLSCELKYSPLVTPIHNPEYMCILYTYIPTGIRKK